MYESHQKVASVENCSLHCGMAIYDNKVCTELDWSRRVFPELNECQDKDSWNFWI